MSPLAAATVAALFGLPFGSFANVVIARVPERRSVVSPPSACPSCGDPIAPYDNVPVVSWLVLRGRCRSCRAPISAIYPVVELTTAALWFLVTWRLWGTHPLAVPGYLALAFACLVLTVIDARTRRLPDRITYPALATVTVLLAAAALIEGEPGRIGRAAVAGVAACALFLLPALLRPGWVGLGDVKLAPTLGYALGWLSWPAVLVGFYASFLLGGLAGVFAIVVLRRGRRSSLPFGPWLATGAVLGVLLAGPVSAWYGRFLGF
jgi:leader peptidase (prepilin peptidase)/N-methyltransferase